LPEEVSAGPSVPMKIVQSLRGAHRENEINLKGHTKPEVPFVSPGEFDHLFFFNVLEVSGKSAIVAANANFVRDTLSRDTPIDVYVLEYRSPTDLSAICDFRSKSRRPSEK
jgi:hypothetical protein